MSTQQQFVKLAQTLPPMLLRFFARYPPPAISQSIHQQNSSNHPSTTTALNTSSSDPNASHEETVSSLTAGTPEFLNPFQCQKHPITGIRHDPIYSLRRQADLVKMARANGVEELLPFTVKGTEARIRKREELGLRVKGTGVGQKVKGKGWERTMKGRLDKRKKAMLEMPQLIQSWKQVIVLSCPCPSLKLTPLTERSWSWMEKVSQMSWYVLGYHSLYYVRGCMGLLGITLGKLSMHGVA